MPALTVVTNNRSIRDHLCNGEYDFTEETVEGTPIDVLVRTLLFLQSGHRLISTPLPPNIPLMRSPHRSLLLEASASKYDIEGIEAVEKARKTMVRQRSIICDDDRQSHKAADFARIDAELLARTFRDYFIIKENR